MAVAVSVARTVVRSVCRAVSAQILAFHVNLRADNTVYKADSSLITSDKVFYEAP